MPFFRELRFIAYLIKVAPLESRTKYKATRSVLHKTFHSQIVLIVNPEQSELRCLLV